MSLKQQIYADVITAMKAKESLKLDTLRMLKAAIMKFEVAGAKKEARDEDVLKIIKREIKQRQDSMAQFEAVGRSADAEKEKAEAQVLSLYLPEEMPAEAVRKIVLDSIQETGFKSKSDFGKIMGVVMQKVGGNADGNLVRTILQESLI